MQDGSSSGFHFVGTLMEVFRIISQHLGLCMRLVKVPDNEGGVRAANGSWSGLVGMVHRGEVNVSTLLVTTWERFKDIDASEFLYMEAHAAGYKRPVFESDIVGFIKPFSPSVWLMVLMTVGLVLTAICLLRLARESFQWVRMSSSLGPVEPQTTKSVGVGTITEESVLWTVSAFLAQAVPLRSPEGVVRQVTGLWLPLALILVTVYRSNLKDMLILPKVSLPFDNLEELVQTDLPVWVATGSILHDAAKTAAANTALGRLNPMFNSVSAPTNVTWGVEDFLLGKHVITGPRSAIHQIIHDSFSQTGRCMTYLMSESFITTLMGSLVFTKGSSLKAKFDPMTWTLLILFNCSSLSCDLKETTTDCPLPHSPYTYLLPDSRCLTHAPCPQPLPHKYLLLNSHCATNVLYPKASAHPCLLPHRQCPIRDYYPTASAPDMSPAPQPVPQTCLLPHNKCPTYASCPTARAPHMPPAPQPVIHTCLLPHSRCPTRASCSKAIAPHMPPAPHQVS
ncbi:uncharacterized protein [Panulirus ornatus]|uniref:uncharacterized protein n=1 Tax=Panulirus ornatus TaxID=150431 RepID=UPI003A8C6F34